MTKSNHAAPNSSAAWAVFDREGHPRALLDRMTGRWGLLVIMGLSGGPKRFGELHALVEGCSEKMLTKSLRELERSGLVSRTPHATIPPRVDYELTELGHSAARVALQLAQWVQENSQTVIQHERRYDAPNSDEQP